MDSVDLLNGLQPLKMMSVFFIYDKRTNSQKNISNHKIQKEPARPTFLLSCTKREKRKIAAARKVSGRSSKRDKLALHDFQTKFKSHLAFDLLLLILINQNVIQSRFRYLSSFIQSSIYYNKIIFLRLPSK